MRLDVGTYRLLGRHLKDEWNRAWLAGDLRVCLPAPLQNRMRRHSLATGAPADVVAPTGDDATSSTHV